MTDLPKYSFDTNQIQFIKQCITKWIECGYPEGKGLGGYGSFVNMRQVSCDVSHSSLLWRLLAGETASKYPPPRAMSYPWMEIPEGKTCKKVSCFVYGHDNIPGIFDKDKFKEIYPLGYANIEQGAWKIVEVVAPDTYIVEWMDGHPWRVRLEKYDGEVSATDIKHGFCWTVIPLPSE